MTQDTANQSTAGTQDLESAMQSLELLVTRLESGELSLEESLSTFEKGIQLSKSCEKSLANAEQKVRVLTEKSTTAPLQDQPTSTPADTASSDDALPF